MENLPLIYKTAEEVIKAYPNATKNAYDFNLKTFGSSYTDEYRNSLTLEKYINDLMNALFPRKIDFNSDEVIRLASENKDKIIKKLKSNGYRTEEEQNLWFWNQFFYFYSDYQDKLEREARKEKELAEKEARKQEKELKKQAKISYIKIDGIFDKSSNDLIWQQLLELKSNTLKYLDNIKNEFVSLKKGYDFYANEIAKLGVKDNNFKSAKVMYLHLTKRYAISDIQLSLSGKDTIERVLNADIDYKYADLLKRVYDKIGTEIKDVKLYNSKNGSLNGYIVSNKGRVDIETILAWGEIYRPHYRVLVK